MNNPRHSLRECAKLKTAANRKQKSLIDLCNTYVYCLHFIGLSSRSRQLLRRIISISCITPIGIIHCLEVVPNFRIRLLIPMYHTSAKSNYLNGGFAGILELNPKGTNGSMLTREKVRLTAVTLVMPMRIWFSELSRVALSFNRNKSSICVHSGPANPRRPRSVSIKHAIFSVPLDPLGQTNRTVCIHNPQVDYCLERTFHYDSGFLESDFDLLFLACIKFWQ